MFSIFFLFFFFNLCTVYFPKNVHFFFLFFFYAVFNSIQVYFLFFLSFSIILSSFFLFIINCSFTFFFLNLISAFLCLYLNIITIYSWLRNLVEMESTYWKVVKLFNMQNKLMGVHQSDISKILLSFFHLKLSFLYAH